MRIKITTVSVYEVPDVLESEVRGAIELNDIEYTTDLVQAVTDLNRPSTSEITVEEVQ